MSTSRMSSRARSHTLFRKRGKERGVATRDKSSLVYVSPMIHHLSGQALFLPAQLLQQRVNPLFVFIDERGQDTERWKALAEVTGRRTRSSRHLLSANVLFPNQFWD